MTTDKDNVETDEKQFLMKIGKEYYYLFFFEKTILLYL